MKAITTVITGCGGDQHAALGATFDGAPQTWVRGGGMPRLACADIDNMRAVCKCSLNRVCQFALRARPHRSIQGRFIGKDRNYNSPAVRSDALQLPASMLREDQTGYVRSVPAGGVATAIRPQRACNLKPRIAQRRMRKIRRSI